MAHLLMVESWVGSMSRLLPRALGEAGHDFTFLTRDLHHYLRSAPEGAAHPLLAARNVLTRRHQRHRRPAAAGRAAARCPALRRRDHLLRLLPADRRPGSRRLLGLPGPSARSPSRTPAARTPPAGSSPPPVSPGRASRSARTGRRPPGRPGDRLSAGRQAGRPVRGHVRAPRRRRGATRRGRTRRWPASRVNARGQRRAPAVLLEEFLDGPEVSVETVTTAGRRPRGRA